MKEIIDLNKWLLDHPADLFFGRRLNVECKRSRTTTLSGFPPECREKIQTLRAEIEKRIQRVSLTA